MPYLFFFGSLFVAYGAPLVVFLVVCARRPQLVIIAVTASLFWILALLASSLLWSITTFSKNLLFLFIIFGVIAQEVSRYYFIKYYQKGLRTFTSIGTNPVVFPIDDIHASVAAGCGWALTSSLVLYGTAISKSLGPATFIPAECTTLSGIVMADLNSLVFGVLHIFLMMIAVEGYRLQSRWKVIGMVLLHLVSSLLTLLNVYNGLCIYSVAVVAVFTMAAGVCVFWFISTKHRYRPVVPH